MMGFKRYYSNLVREGRVHFPTPDEARQDFAGSERQRLQGHLWRSW
jgi:hypothetical protein